MNNKTDAISTLGTIIEEGKRDAIHVAVEPCMAAEKLYPGQHVGIVKGMATTKADKKVGIVDPFLNGFVPEGKMFWLLIYPRTITSLRHAWTHPDFGEMESIIVSKQKEVSEAWLRHFCEISDCPPYDIVIAAAVGEQIPEIGGYISAYRLDNEQFFFHGRDAHSEIPAEFWDHVEIVTGKKPPFRPTYFTCSC